MDPTFIEHAEKVEVAMSVGRVALGVPVVLLLSSLGAGMTPAGDR
jgi:hypothetical protein